MEFSKTSRKVFLGLSFFFKFAIVFILFYFGYLVVKTGEISSHISPYLYLVFAFLFLQVIFNVLSYPKGDFYVKLKNLFLKLFAITFIFFIIGSTFFSYSSDFVSSIQPSIDEVIIQVADSQFEKLDYNSEVPFFLNSPRIEKYSTTSLSENQILFLADSFGVEGSFDDKKKFSEKFLRLLHDQLQLQTSQSNTSIEYLNEPLPFLQLVSELKKSNFDPSLIPSLPLTDSMEVTLYFLFLENSSLSPKENLILFRNQCQLVSSSSFCKPFLLTEYSSLILELQKEFPEYSSHLDSISSLEKLKQRLDEKKNIVLVLLFFSLVFLVLALVVEMNFSEHKEQQFMLFFKDLSFYLSIQCLLSLISLFIFFFVLTSGLLDRAISQVFSAIHSSISITVTSLPFFIVLKTFFSSLLTIMLIGLLVSLIVFFSLYYVVHSKKNTNIHS
jgi:hypothetical protein